MISPHHLCLHYGTPIHRGYDSHWGSVPHIICRAKYQTLRSCVGMTKYLLAFWYLLLRPRWCLSTEQQQRNVRGVDSQGGIIPYTTAGFHLRSPVDGGSSTTDVVHWSYTIGTLDNLSIADCASRPDICPIISLPRHSLPLSLRTPLASSIKGEENSIFTLTQQFVVVSLGWDKRYDTLLYKCTLNSR